MNARRRLCEAPDPDGMWQCTEPAGHAHTWHRCYDRISGRVYRTWETT